MVSFSCEVCNDTVIKKRLGQHQSKCPQAYFTCIDCNTTFYNNEHHAHTSCITEAQKYEKGMYKPKKQKEQPKQQKEQPKKEPKKEEPKVEPKKDDKPAKKDTKDKKDKKDKKSSSSVTDDFNKLLKVDKSTNFKKVLKKLPKSKQKALLKSLSVVKTSDNTIKLSF